MLQIEIMATSPTFGGGGSIYLVGEFLAEGLAPAGAAVERIEVHFLLTELPKAPVETDDGASVDEVEALLAALIEEESESFGIGPNDPEWGRAHEEERRKGAVAGVPSQRETDCLAAGEQPVGAGRFSIKTHDTENNSGWEVRHPFPGIIIWRDPYGAHYLVDPTGTRRVTGTPGDSDDRALTPADLHFTEFALTYAAN